MFQWRIIFAFTLHQFIKSPFKREQFCRMKKRFGCCLPLLDNLHIYHQFCWCDEFSFVSRGSCINLPMLTKFFRFRLCFSESFDTYIPMFYVSWRLLSLSDYHLMYPSFSPPSMFLFFLPKIQANHLFIFYTILT